MAVGARWLLVLLTLAVPRSGVCQAPNSITQAACDTDPCFSTVVASCGSCFPTQDKTVSVRLSLVCPRRPPHASLPLRVSASVGPVP